MIIGVIIFTFSVAKSAQSIGTNYFFPQMVVNITDRDVSRLLKSSINLNIEPKIIMPSSIRIITKSDLRNFQWLKEFLLSLSKHGPIYCRVTENKLKKTNILVLL